MKLIGLCGYAQVGKDTAAENMPGWTRFAFADALKRDLAPILASVGCDLNNPAHKREARNLLVQYGEVCRAFRPNYWIERLFASIIIDGKNGDPIVITDVRYLNEVKAILNRGGHVVRIERPGFEPANETESISIKLIDLDFRLPIVVNDGTPEELGRRVLEALR